MRRGTVHLNGWLPVDKPAGITSAYAVNRLKRLLSARKAGHAGTLDKSATGVLAVAFGEATKTIPYVMDSRKTYMFRVKFGESTTTDDATGEVLEATLLRPSDSAVLTALEQFRGEILQVPPQYSAVKISGKRAASYAVQGNSQELAARPLTVHRLELTARPSPDVAEFEMVCGKGGYVRSIARDLGQFLGCHGHVLDLRRTAAGPFSLNDCAEFSAGTDDEERRRLMEKFAPLEAGLAGVTEVTCSPKDARRIRSGNPIRIDGGRQRQDAWVWVSCGGRAVAIGRIAGGAFNPKRVINCAL